MKQRNIRNVLGLICPNPEPSHGVVVGCVSSVNLMSTRVYRPQQLVDCQVSTFSDQARDHGLPGVSPGIPPLQTCGGSISSMAGSLADHVTRKSSNLPIKSKGCQVATINPSF